MRSDDTYYIVMWKIQNYKIACTDVSTVFLRKKKFAKSREYI